MAGPDPESIDLPQGDSAPAPQEQRGARDCRRVHQHGARQQGARVRTEHYIRNGERIEEEGPRMVPAVARVHPDERRVAARDVADSQFDVREI